MSRELGSMSKRFAIKAQWSVTINGSIAQQRKCPSDGGYVPDADAFLIETFLSTCFSLRPEAEFLLYGLTMMLRNTADRPIYKETEPLPPTKKRRLIYRDAPEAEMAYGYAPRSNVIETWQLSFKAGVGKMNQPPGQQQNPPIGGMNNLRIPLEYQVGAKFTQTPFVNVQAPPKMTNTCFSNPPAGGSLENSGWWR